MFLTKKLRIISIFLIISLSVFLLFTIKAQAFQKIDVTSAIEEITNNYSQKTEISQWEALGLILNEKTLNQSFVKNLKNEVFEKSGEYRLVTDYARIIIILRASGYSPLNFEGYNLVEKMLNSKNMTLQGVNGPIFSLISMHGLNTPSNTIWNSQQLLNEILKYQNADGGFSLTLGQDSSIDITAMAVYALSNYNQTENVKTSVDKALFFLSNSLADDGNYYYLGQDSSESLSQLIIGLCKIGIDINDQRFVKNNKTLVDTLLEYRMSKDGFSHTKNGEVNDMATQQALLALTAYTYYCEGKGGIYDTNKFQNDVFSDMSEVSPWAKDYIKRAKELNLILGDDNGKVNPKKCLSRAEFVTMLVRMQALDTSEYKGIFSDVDKTSWYWAAVECAYNKKIINGRGSGIFAPDDVLTNQDFAVIVSNAFLLLSKEQAKIKDIDNANEYAKPGIRSLLNADVWHYSEQEVFYPANNITREQAISTLVMIFDSGAKQKEGK